MNREQTKNALLTAMSVGSVQIVFTKLDGTRRTAQATLNSQFINSRGATPKGDGEVKYTPDQCRYFDIEADGWRSFLWSRLVEPELPAEEDKDEVEAES